MELAVRIAPSRTDILDPDIFPLSIDLRYGLLRPINHSAITQTRTFIP